MNGLSHNQKLAKQWKNEHREIVALCGKIIKDYKDTELDRLGKDLAKLNEIITDHLMSEDLEFYKFSMLEEALNQEIKDLIEEFIDTFEETKIALVDFLTKYTQPEVTFNKEFIITFKGLVTVLGKRMTYEENTLYSALQVH